MNKDYLIGKTKEVENNLGKRLEKLGFSWRECFLRLRPGFPCDEFFAECNITFKKNGERFFTFLGAFQEDVICLPNDEAVDKILEDLINGFKKKLEEAKRNGKLKHLHNISEETLKKLELNRE